MNEIVDKLKNIKYRGFYDGKMYQVKEIRFETEEVCLWKGKASNFILIETSKVELMQFTGLRDCNGVEICEGDIVKVKYNEMSWGRKIEHDFVGLVCCGEFESVERDGIYDYILGWFIKVKDTSLSLLNYDGNIEVIGHKFKNLTLLESPVYITVL